MAKTSAVQQKDYRKLDVDAYEEDLYVEEADQSNARDTQAGIKAREGKVQQALNGNRILDALRASLEDPPTHIKDENCRLASAQNVVLVVNACKDADVDKTVDQLSDDELDLLMKYIYRALSVSTDSAKLLKWHASIERRGGIGCIVRAITDRHTV